MSVSAVNRVPDDKASVSPVQATLSQTSVAATPSPASGGSRHNDNNANHHELDRSISNSHDNNDDEFDVRSPTCVTMVCSSSSATLLPTAAASVVAPTRTRRQGAEVPKPFFVMDWLEEINPRDLELARQMLQTPTKNKKQQQHQRSQSTPTVRSQRDQQSPSASSDQRQPARSSINLPNLNHEKDSEPSICRQLYPAAGTAPSISAAAAVNGGISRATSATSVTTAGSLSAAPDGPTCTPEKKQQQQPIVKMSPFKERSIAIGNGWNAKGLHKAKKGSWESALACWENALEIRTQVLGEMHPDVANTCNNMGIALGKLGKYDAAIEVLERALELRAKHYETREHVEVAATLHNIGNVLHAAQDCAGAIQCFWNAKLLQEQLLGPNHVQVARACVAIANVYFEAQQYDDAREAYHDALQVFANAGLSERHPEVLAIHQDLHDIQSVCNAAACEQHPAVMAAQQQQMQYQFHHHYHHYHEENHHHYPSHTSLFTSSLEGSEGQR